MRGLNGRGLNGRGLNGRGLNVRGLGILLACLAGCVTVPEMPETAQLHFDCLADGTLVAITSFPQGDAYVFAVGRCTDGRPQLHPPAQPKAPEA